MTSTEGTTATILGLDHLSEDAVNGGKGGTGSTVAGGTSMMSTAGSTGESATHGQGSMSMVPTNMTIPSMSLQNPTTIAASENSSNITTTGGGVHSGESAAAALPTLSPSPVTSTSTSSSRARSKSTSLAGDE